MASDTLRLPLFSAELLLAYAFTVIAAVLVVVSNFFLPTQVPLWYSLAIPEHQLVPKLLLFVFPILMSTICFTHTAIINKLRSIDPAVVKIFSYGTTLVTFLFLVGLTHIIYIFL